MIVPSRGNKICIHLSTMYDALPYAPERMLLFWPPHGIEAVSRVSPSLLLLRLRQGVVQGGEGPAGAHSGSGRGVKGGESAEVLGDVA